MKRRNFLKLLGIGAGAVATGPLRLPMESKGQGVVTDHGPQIVWVDLETGKYTPLDKVTRDDIARNWIYINEKGSSAIVNPKGLRSLE